MKIYHFALLFLLFFLVAVINTDISIGKLKEIENEKENITLSLSSASSDAVNYLSKTGSYGGGSINKEEVLSKFFASLYSSMGVISDKAIQTELEIYIPVILLCDTDGYYVYYYDEYKATDGNTYIERTWTEKMPYAYEDDNFIYRFTLTDMVYIYDKNNILNIEESILRTEYQEFQNNPAYMDFRTNYSDSILLNDEGYNLVRKESIISKLEEVMAYYTSRHNMIASRQGITYTFSFPTGRQDEWAEYVDDVNIIVVFQGYPYGPDRNYTYNKIASSAANIIKRPKFLVEEKSWYLLAHKEGCNKITESSIMLDDKFDTIEECARLGAYSCECIEHGARVPELKDQ